MMTREMLLNEMRVSEVAEEQTYKELTLRIFQQLQAPLKALYDEMVAATAHLTALTPDAVKKHPRTIKILRYCLAPVISQLRLGQILELDTKPFEVQGKEPTDEQASRLAQWFCDYLDRERFPWVARPELPTNERVLAEHYAKLCTVALVSNQNTTTEYRNQRKDRQENAIADKLQEMGLNLQDQLELPPIDPSHPSPPKRPGGINDVDDILPGHFFRGGKIIGRSDRKQQADFNVRPTEALKLFCIEAKAVGIRKDSIKRIIEINEKYTDWARSGLPLTTIAVCAGFFNASEIIATIKKRGIPIFFEHALDHLVEFLTSGAYYGTPWEPATQFPEVPAKEVDVAFEQIEIAPVDEEVSADDSDREESETE